MIYLTAFRSVTLSFLHAIITATFLAMLFARLGWISEMLPGVGHLGIGVLAFYHAIGSLSFPSPDKPSFRSGRPSFLSTSLARLRENSIASLANISTCATHPRRYVSFIQIHIKFFASSPMTLESR